jgi:hypothetical protein
MNDIKLKFFSSNERHSYKCRKELESDFEEWINENSNFRIVNVNIQNPGAGDFNGGLVMIISYFETNKRDLITETN